MKGAVDRKRERERKVVEEMILLYCKGHHREQVPCQACQELIAYARERTAKCPFMETKTFCSNCRVHCYDAKHRTQIKEVMRYSGPRMLLRHPWLAISHVLETRKEKLKLKREERK